MTNFVTIFTVLAPIVYEEIQRYREQRRCDSCGEACPILRTRKHLVHLGWRGTKKLRLFCPECVAKRQKV